jgi:predicted component of type VI protein secretion system
MPAQLLALDDGPSILLDKPILLLGRHPECDIQIDSRKISRRHCCIAQVSDYLVVRDLGSTNGIRINGTRVVEGRLEAGDELTLGNNRYKVKWDNVPSAPKMPPAEQRPTVRESSLVAGAEDELLESCDDPVPLDEPAGGPPVAKALAPPIVPGGEESLHLPDELELLPKSGIFPNLSPHQSGSHPSV